MMAEGRVWRWWFDDLGDDELYARLVNVAALSADAAQLIVRHRDGMGDDIARLLQEDCP